MTIDSLRSWIVSNPAWGSLPWLDIIAWALLPVLAAVVIVWTWRLLRAAAGVLSWVILIGALFFVLTRLVIWIPS